MIFHSLKTIFVHIPKAGGTSVENLLWPNASSRTESDLWMGFVRPFYNKYQTGGLQHLLAKQIQYEIGNTIFSEYYKFAIVRNPWSKSVSQFVYMSMREDLRNFINMKPNTTFIEYLNLILKKDHVQWKSQVDFILDHNGEILIDDFYKLEEIKDNFSKLSEKTGANFSLLPHANKGKYYSFKDYYDKESIELVSEIYKNDINFFKYTYD